MSYLSYALSLLGDLEGQSAVSASSKQHAVNLAALVKERGGTEKDQALCLLHEIPDLASDALDHIDEDFRESVTALSAAMPDFLRHSDDEILARASALLSARRPTQVIWMCDLLETMTNERIRIGVPEAQRDRMAFLKERVGAAIKLLDRFESYNTLGLFMDQVRSEALRVMALISRDQLRSESPSFTDHAARHGPSA